MYKFNGNNQKDIMERINYKQRIKLAKKQARQNRINKKVGEIIKMLPAVIVLISILAVAGYMDQIALTADIIH